MQLAKDSVSNRSAPIYPIARMFRRIRASIQPFAKAALFELRDRGYSSLFEQLVGCIISIRTYDEISLACALNLFRRARTPSALKRLSVDEIDHLIKPATFHFQKAGTLKNLARQIEDEYGGLLPADDKILQSLHGVGPKCAHLALGIAENQPMIGVDIHVHRITNRWGYVRTASPEKTMRALEQILPKSRWIEINELLVPFGKHFCTAKKPLCSRCPVHEDCLRIGITDFR